MNIAGLSLIDLGTAIGLGGAGLGLALTTVGLRAPGRESRTRRRRQAGGSLALPLALAVVAALALFVYLFRLGVPTWLGDEVVYRDAGYQYVHGKFELALENPPLVKYILGVTQVVLGSDPLPIRLPAATAGLLTGVVLFLFARQAGGPWAGVLALGLWSLLPRPELVGGVEIGRVKIDRYARLEVFMALFAALALFGGWRWAESGRWRPALLSGVALGLAVACKAPAVLVLPAILLSGLVTLGITRRSLLQAGSIVAISALSAAAAYVPMLGKAPHAIDFMFSASDWRNAIGHPFVFDGKLHEFAPWWANFWWQWKALGTPAALAVAVCLAVAPFLLRRGLAILLVTAVLLPAAFLAFGLNYALPYYYYSWEAPLLLLCALVLHRLATLGTAARACAAIIVAPLAIAAALTVRDVSRIHTRDYAAVAKRLGPTLGGRTVVTWDLDSFTIMRAELPGTTIGFDPRGVKRLGVILVDPTASARRANPSISAYLRDHRADLKRLDIDRLRVYVPSSAASERRLAAEASKVPPVRKDVAVVGACLRAAGLSPRVSTATPGAKSESIRTPLSRGNSTIVWVYRSAQAARADVRAIDGFLARGGGRAAVRGHAVVGFARKPTPSEADRVESCAS